MAREKLENLWRGLKRPFTKKKTAISTIFISALSLVFIALSSSINYSIQMFSAGFRYWVPAILRRVTGLYAEGGLLSISTTVVYSLLIGITLSNLYTQFRNSGFKKRNLSGIGPGFIAAGCAGCGVGILSFLGVAGGLAAMPFNGQLIRVGGMALLVYYIVRTGDPEVCSIPSS